ncbi:citronellol/citronellal dehydrogenase [Burkholderiales bacterium]|nr:citronellol/citronellal dehydrogenase [Burkholderiales bacterium]
MSSLAGRTLFVTGGSRGIGLAIAVRAARDGANVAIAAKTDAPNPKLPGTIHTAAREIEAAGGHALPIACDLRDDDALRAAVATTVARFGGIDILVNNASAIGLTGTEATPMKRYDLMMDVNVRGTFLATQSCVPHLRASARAGRGPHVLTLSPPPTLDPRWYRDHVAYTISKMGMSLAVLGHAEEFRADGIGVNALWPRTVIRTAAIAMLPGVGDQVGRLRTPEIVADAAHAILVRDPRECTGRFFIDEEALREAGVTDLSRYAVEPGRELLPDLFVD